MSKINFEGYKYRLVNREKGNSIRFNDCDSNYSQLKVGIDVYDLFDWALHTNPDYKEIGMNSNKLADEIMAKGKEAVYTREMFNKSETPKVGMQVGVRFNKASQPNYGKLIALTEQYIILLEGVAQEQHYTRGTWIFVPVDHKEQAIESLEYVINNLPVSIKSDAKLLAESLVNSMAESEFEFLSFTGDKK